ncbi:DUF86 domain-containing protein [Reichenbachiella sp. MALMAid0571]|uniref:HepT-like ribonuclease domain-containing protein n=1 Tax=Reichenbachiella sp. MALMAid0571 TaxID=3143939 RepID=UPI0032DEF652
MSKRNPLLLLEDMLESAQKIKKYTNGQSIEQFTNDEKTVDAVVRNFEIIGEAASRIDLEFRYEYPQIEWKRLKGFRNRLIHDYFGVDYEIVWEIIQSDLDELIFQLESIIKR